MASTRKTKQKQSKKALQASPAKAAVRNRLKQAPPQLAEIIRLVNLMPKMAAMSMPEGLNPNGEAWEAELLKALNGSGFSYTDIRQAHKGLRGIIHQGLDWLPIYTIDGGSIITIGPGYKAQAHLDRFGEAIQGVDVRYLRECAACKAIFFAGRIYDNPHYSAGCSKKCNKKLRNEKWKQQFEQGNPRYHK